MFFTFDFPLKLLWVIWGIEGFLDEFFIHRQEKTIFGLFRHQHVLSEVNICWFSDLRHQFHSSYIDPKQGKTE